MDVVDSLLIGLDAEQLEVALHGVHGHVLLPEDEEEGALMFSDM